MTTDTVVQAGSAAGAGDVAADGSAIHAPRAGVGAGSEPARVSRWRRLRTWLMPQPWTEQDRSRCLERLLALLEGARADLDAGWVQGAWWSMPASGGAHRLVTGLAAATATPDQRGGACLVGALVRTGSGGHSDAASEVARAVDAVYDALWESRGQTPTDPLWKVSAPPVRLAKVQALTSWNDEPGRTRDEVMAVLDRAIARTIQTLMTVPATPSAEREYVTAGWH